MKKTNFLIKTCMTVLIGLCSVIGVNAAGVHTHDYPISDTQAHEFMTKYFGWIPTSGTNYENKKAKLGTPTDVQDGDVLLIEVNPYWRGVYMYPTVNDKTDYKTANGATLWEEVKYGVKDVHFVGAPNRTADGYLYSYTGQLGRFYFAKKRTSYYNENGTREFSTYYRLLGRWYDEWSFLPTPDGSAYGWANFAGVDNYFRLMNGDVWYAPHNCLNSLDKNHFASFIDDGTEDYKDGYTATILFYISDYWDTNDVRGNGSTTTKNPFICMYRNNQNPTDVVESGDGYDVKVEFTSTFTNVTDAIGSSSYGNEDMWNNTDGDVKEYFEIWRTDKDGNRVLVDRVASDDTKLTYDSTTHTYTYTDDNNGEHFSSDGEYGTDYTYEIVSELYNVDKDGNIVGEEPITTTQSETQNAHIPGHEAFTLSIAGGTKCVFTLSTTYLGGVNNFTHIIDVDVNKGGNSIKVKTGDVIQLKQEYGNAVNTIKELTITEDLNGKSIMEILGSDDWKQITYEFQKSGGETQDAYYQLKFIRNTGSETAQYYSNILYLNSYCANIDKGQYSHRQGHPSGYVAPENSELYHNEVKFTPSSDANIYRYDVVCNGNEREVLTVTEEEYTGGQPYNTTRLHSDKIVNDGETSGEKEAVSMFYTVIAYDRAGNTYGSTDVKFDYIGIPQELVYWVVPGESTPVATRSMVDHHDKYIWEGAIALQLNNGQGVGASDVKPELITGVKTYGKINGVEKEFCSFETLDTEGLSLFNFISVDLETDSRYSTYKTTLDNAYRAYGEDLTNPKIVETWRPIVEKLWYDNMPTEMYTEITYDESTLNLVSSKFEDVNKMPLMRTPSDNFYKKYTNWAPVVPPNFDNVPITGTETIETSTINVYPTVTSDHFNVDGYEGEVSLYNLTGYQVKNSYSNGSTTINVSDLNNGVYILKAGSFTKKVVVK